MDIGSKIKKSRADAKITQEQAAQALGISRQTISNWENERSYPDIVSVLKMSELYSVSLDYLLKGEGPMKDYLDYIEESTNTVKSKVRLSKLLLVLSYLVIWAFNIMASWRFSAGSITEAQAGGAQWIMLPAATIVLSLLIGKKMCIRDSYSHDTALYLLGYSDRTPAKYTMTFPKGYNCLLYTSLTGQITNDSINEAIVS